MSGAGIGKTINIIFLLAQATVLLCTLLVRNYTNAIDALSGLVGFTILLVYEKVKKIRLEDYVRFFLVLTIMSHHFIGNHLGLYDTRLSVDKLLHMFGSFSMALVAYSLTIKTVKAPLAPKAYTFLLSVSLGVAVGVVFELLEYILDVLFKTLNQSGLTDTNLDLFYNLVGCILAGIFLLLRTPDE